MSSGETSSRGQTPDMRRLVHEKLQILRLLRALDRAGINPAERPRLHAPLVRIAEVDGMLDSVLELLERTVGGEDLGEEALTGLLHIAEEMRGAVGDALDADDRAAFHRARGEVVASEAEVWMEVDALRRRSRPGPAPRRPLTSDEVARAAENAWGRKRQPRPRGEAKVKAEERRELPPDDAPLVAWFERMPERWREGVARIHDVPLDDAGARARRIAERLSDEAWLRRFLEERLGASERGYLAWLSEGGCIPLKTVRRGLGSGLEVHWDWSSGLPASAGGKLRAAGLVHVGMRNGEKVAVVPLALRAAIREALGRVDPDAARGPERAMRQAAVTALTDAPFADRDLDRWKRIDKQLTTVFEGWVLEQDREHVQRALDLLFGDEPRHVRSVVEQTALFEFVLFDWRSAPGEPTLAECRLANAKLDTESRTLAAATISTLPRIYRIGTPLRGEHVELTPTFPAGPPVVLNDRSLSLTVEEGWSLGARLYPAGRFHFARLLGDPVAPEREKRLLRALAREVQSFVSAGGPDDPEAWIRARPERLIRTLRAYHE